MVEQEQLDNMMIEMDGTENKCELEQLTINNNQIIRVHSQEVTHDEKHSYWRNILHAASEALIQRGTRQSRKIAVNLAQTTKNPLKLMHLSTILISSHFRGRD